MSKVEPQQLKFDFGAYKGLQVPHCPLCGGNLIQVGLRQTVLKEVKDKGHIIGYFPVEHYWEGPIYQCWACLQALGYGEQGRALPWDQILRENLPRQPRVLVKQPKHHMIGEDVYEEV